MTGTTPIIRFGVMGDVDLLGMDGAVESLVNSMSVPPGRSARGEGAWGLPQAGHFRRRRGRSSGAGSGRIRRRCERGFPVPSGDWRQGRNGEPGFPGLGPFGADALEFLAVVAVEAVALDDGGVDAFPPENVLENLLTVLVPAPDEPVTAMTGCLIDMPNLP